MTWQVPWLVRRPIDIARNYAIKVSPAYNESHRDTTLVHAFSVVGSPYDGVGNTRVYAHCPEEQAGILNTRLAR